MLNSRRVVYFKSVRIMSTKAIPVGITGSIGMGKSALASHFKDLGFPVFDADATVHKLYSPGGLAVNPIKQHFPTAVCDDRVNRQVLSCLVLQSKTNSIDNSSSTSLMSPLQLLESIVHPLVQAERSLFYEKHCQQGHFLVVYDIPLLFENQLHTETQGTPASEIQAENTTDLTTNANYVKYSILASAPENIQKERVLKRENMTEEKFQSIIAKQLSDDVKRTKADYIIDTSSTCMHAFVHVYCWYPYY